MRGLEESGGLALFGCRPVFSKELHVGRPNIGDRKAFLERVTQILDCNWLTNDGPLAREFEQRIADYAKTRYCSVVSNATVGLQIAARAMGLKGEVIVPSFTFIATAHALEWIGLRPVFADIDSRTYNVDPSSIESRITARTTGVLGVHLWGRPCWTEAIEDLARRHGLQVFYDAAHALGCARKGRKVGGFGACEVFSFHATKFVNSFEGGAIVTNDAQLAGKIARMRNHGFQHFDSVVSSGTNGKMTEVCAAMGITSLEAAAGIVATNRLNLGYYRRGLSGLKGVSLMEYDAGETPNYQYIVVEVDPDAASLNRDELLAVLHRENVLARRYFWPGCHRMEPYRLRQQYDLPETERVAARVLQLPNGTAVGEREIDLICGIIRAALCHSARVRSALRQQAGLAHGEPGTVLLPQAVDRISLCSGERC
jgi:dTDP-4-amino-4,6-dideoxygalactose transaminase